MLSKRSIKRLEKALNPEPEKHIIPLLGVFSDVEKQEYCYKGKCYKTMEELKLANNAPMRIKPIVVEFDKSLYNTSVDPSIDF